MALPDLAVAADLSDRGVDISDSGLVAVMLAAASAVVRDSAGSPISETTSTVVLTAWGETLLRLPGLPVTAVSAASVDGDAVTDFTLTDASALWRRTGWGYDCEPALVEVTMTHGLPTVPADVVQLVCDLAIAGMGAATEGALDPRVVAEKIDDYAVTFASGADAVASAMTLPRMTRSWLRARFGGGAQVVTYR